MEFPGRVIGGFGFHDVVIENPVHSVQLSDMEPREIGEVFLAHKKRIQQIMSVQSIKYVQVFFLLLFSEFVCVFGHVQSMSRFFSAFGDGFFS
jgi:hypothetical protein